MKTLLRSTFCLLVLVSVLHASGDEQDVQNARRLLPAGLWSMPIEIRNTKPDQRYPAVCHGLAFEFGDLLWLYTPHDGTQSLSSHYGASSKDKLRLGDLLREVHPGFVSYSSLPSDEDPARGPRIPKNACFLCSVRAASESIGREREVLDLALLCYYYEGLEASGHTVLSYRTPEGCFVLDPGEKAAPVRVNMPDLSDPLSFAKAIQTDMPIAKARFFRGPKGKLWQS